ncbi:DUF1223 domain-containing protein [Rhodobacterales bacterium HKCCE2091]|nr:DUF1223 domain-containing protein [Rhodobacterales bacterium HKCCE2091]
MVELRRLACALGLAAATTATAASAEGPVVVELFTSQGCSSCPPADALLAELAGNDHVIALALHVDYWDYIGWPDTFADAAFTARQHQYARVAGSGTVYTPQMIIGGTDHVVGHRPMAVMDRIMAQAETPAPVDLSTAREGDGFALRAEMQGTPPRGGIDVQLVGFVPHERVAIGRGENANRTIDYHNIVRSWQVIAEWDGRSPFEASVTPADGLDYAVILQAAGQGPILAAALLD